MNVEQQKRSMANQDLYGLAWPQSRLGEAIAVLAQAAGLTSQIKAAPLPPTHLVGADYERLSQWVWAVTASIGAEAESVAIAYPDIEKFIRRAAPAILQLPTQSEACFLLLSTGGHHQVTLIAPNFAHQQVAVATIQAVLCQPLEAPLITEIQQLLQLAGVTPQQQPHAQRVLLQERLRNVSFDAGWILRPTPYAAFGRQLRQTQVIGQLVALVGIHLLYYSLWLLSWYLIGRGVFYGAIDQAWLWGWTLLLLTLVPLRMLLIQIQNKVAITVGARLKDRLLFGALQLHPDELRHQGVGQLLGRVIESEALETLALNGGFLALLATIELLLAMVVFAWGATGWLHICLLVGWLLFVAYGSWRYYIDRQGWTATRMSMTHHLVEQMVGYRTRLVQESETERHRDEDWLLADYLAQSTTVDQTAQRLLAYSAKGWLVAGGLGLAPVFLTSPEMTASFAVTVGGILSVYVALRRLVNGYVQLIGAVIAWEQIKEIFQAAERIPINGDPALAVTMPEQRSDDLPILQATDLVYRYPNRPEPVVHNCTFAIQQGQRILLEGLSGGGKSTLAALVIGLRQPDAGLLLLAGFDWSTLGNAGWRRRIVAAPQFHENHVLTETFAFNLLMGRRWPPGAVDLAEAEMICRELGLGDLLARMPGGILQMVGETGWQLSHGERSRLYIARTLLQGADLIVLDESFAALDPKNLQQAMTCVLHRSPTLLVIAHP
jgi:ATP-binding cassette subfamily B protein